MLKLNLFKKTPPPKSLKLPNFPDYSSNFTDLAAQLSKVESRQKEMSLQLEDIDELLQSDEAEDLVQALIAVADGVENFYRLDTANESAEIMWAAVKKQLRKVALTVIDDVGKPYNFELHTIESTVCDSTRSNGEVIETLKCGYIYKDKTYRKSKVIANKSTGENQEKIQESQGEIQ